MSSERVTSPGIGSYARLREDDSEQQRQAVDEDILLGSVLDKAANMAQSQPARPYTALLRCNGEEPLPSMVADWPLNSSQNSHGREQMARAFATISGVCRNV